MTRNTKLFVGLALVTLGLTSCNDDYFDKQRYDELVKNSFPVDNIDPTHKWAMFGTAFVNVAVNNGSGETYRVAIYKENPHTTNRLTQLAQGTVTAGASEQFVFSYELAHTTAYVVIYNEEGRRSVKPVTLLDGRSASVDFFGSRSETPMSRIAHSMAAPAVPGIAAPYDEAWVATYNQTAKEPNSTNAWDNYDNSVYHEGTSGTYAANYSAIDDWEVWGNMWQHGDWDAQVAWLLANGKDYWLTYTPGTEGYWEYDETFVRNFKITGTWNGGINVVATEGLTDGVANNNERTVVVTGTWNITEDQRVGSKGRIIIANGGTVNVAEGKTLNMVNQARLVVLAGGKLTGAGKVEVNNGNAAGEENYNAGTIDVAVFNNNFGKFYNYGKFLVNEYHGGAAESNFYNHALAAIDHFGVYDSSTANARIFNKCQFYVKNNARIRNYEGVAGSALIVGGQLMCSGSEDGTGDASYVGLAGGALVQAGSLYNNGTNWSGPTAGGYAVLSIGQFDFINWVQDHPEEGGYFINNLYVQADTWDNVPGGNGYHQTDPTDAVNYALSIAAYKFENVVANAGGNGNVAIVSKSNKEYIPASEDFVLGVSGCTPGFKTDGFEEEDDDVVITLNSYRYCFEDNFPTPGDYDFNDVVITVAPAVEGNVVKLKVSLDAVGATKVISAAMRIQTLNDDMIESVTCSENMDAGLLTSPGYITAENNGSNVFVVPVDNRADHPQDFTMRLFSDAHWSLGGKAVDTETGIDRYMLNTIKNGNQTLEAKYSNFPVREVTYTFTMKESNSGVKYTDIFTQNNMDVFIVEAHNSIKWEVHTVPFKYDQVILEYANTDKLSSYTGNSQTEGVGENYPWAICAPASFRYPLEWHSICGSKLSLTEEYGYTGEPYPDFAGWAQDKSKNTTWYENATEGLVY
ncbi:MAG: LruC domain-containing protein [Prevotella sp.]|nr:LruC domain-containing protein [Prevotella sp.]